MIIGGRVAPSVTQTGALRHGVGVGPATVQCDTLRKTLSLFGERETQYFGADSEINLSARSVSENNEKFLYLSLRASQVYNIQGEHKNTSLFQVVIKSKVTGIFL